MSATLQLYERWKAHKGFATDTAALKALGLTTGAAQHWKAGRNADLGTLQKMAEDLAEDYVPVVMQAFQEAAKNERDRKAWKRFAKKLGAAGLLAAAMLGAMPEQAQALESIHYAKSGRRRRRTPGEIQPTDEGENVACSPFRRRAKHGKTTMPYPRRSLEPVCGGIVRMEGKRPRRFTRRVERVEIARKNSHLTGR